MKMSDNPTEHEVLTKQYMRSILDISDLYSNWQSNIFLETTLVIIQ